MGKRAAGATNETAWHQPDSRRRSIAPSSPTDSTKTCQAASDRSWLRDSSSTARSTARSRGSSQHGSPTPPRGPDLAVTKASLALSAPSIRSTAGHVAGPSYLRTRNKRAALDNCLYAVAVIDSGQSPPPNADLLEWPICLTPEKWRSNARRFAALSPELRQALEAIQPYQAEQPAWNCLRILHDLARADRHRALHFVTMYGSYGNAKVDLNRIADFEPRIGVVDPGRCRCGVRWMSDDHHINPDNFDLNVEFEIEMAGVVDSPHPDTGRPQRPWGGLDTRLQALQKAVVEYTVGLVAIAKQARAEREAS